MEHLERDPVPFPPVPRGASRNLPRAAGRRDDRVVDRQRRHEPRDRNGAQDRERSPRVIAVGVAHDEHVDGANAGRAQIRRDDARAGVGAVGETGPGVVDKRVPRGDDDNREALADVEHDDARSAVRRCRWDQQDHRQRPQRAQCASRDAPRRERPDEPRDRHGNGPAARCVHRPGRQRQRCKPFEVAHRERQNVMRQHPWHVERHGDAEERERNDTRGNDRDRHRIGECRDQRHHLEERERSRHQAERHDPLRA